MIFDCGEELAQVDTFLSGPAADFELFGQALQPRREIDHGAEDADLNLLLGTDLARDRPSVTDTDTGVYDFDYDALSCLERTTNPDSSSTTRAYDALDRLTTTTAMTDQLRTQRPYCRENDKLATATWNIWSPANSPL